MSRPIVGVLALQGAFLKHAEVLSSLNAVPVFVKRPSELEQCDGLVIPGGESTTIAKRIDFIGMRDALIDFAREKPVFGTCAGLILLSKQSYGVLDAEVDRNAYGTQYDSFAAQIRLSFGPKGNRGFKAIFIRAPRITSLGPEVQTLASLHDEPVLIRQNRLLGATFHPELSGDARIHRHFLTLFK